MVSTENGKPTNCNGKYPQTGKEHVTRIRTMASLKNTHVFFYLGMYQDLLAKNPVVSYSESASTGILI